MEGEAPRMLFLHYIGFGKAAQLAEAVKATIDAQQTTTPPAAHQHHEH